MTHDKIEIALSITVFFSILNWFTWLLCVYSFPLLAVVLYFEVVGNDNDD
jgi:hypothetical protein